MKNFKSILLGAVAVSGMASSGAFAQSTVAPLLVGADLRGAGASAVESVVVEAFNCISGNANAKQLGRGAPAHATLGVFGIQPDANSLPTAGAIQGGSLATIANGVFTGVVSGNPAPPARCATPVQGNFSARYVSTGSGFGRDIWRSFSNRFTSGVTTTTSQSNPFEIVNDATSGWSNVQFAFSEGPISASDLSTYNTNANSATNLAGRAIQIPLYVVPVAVSYNRRYGINTNTGADLFFTVPTGGMRLNQAQYCGIYNGTITNFNQLPTSSVNGSALDVPGRYASTAAGGGVPIRLVGRQDTSGTTDIFTRHLTAVCGTAPFNPVTGLGNKFVGASASLPATAIAATNPAIYDGAGALLSGTEQTRFFARAPGNNGVAVVVALAPDVATPSGVLLSGRLGYNSADFVTPAFGALNDAAQLTQIGSTTAYRTPSAANATAAFATILPPQSTVSSGAYNATGDGRRNSVTGALVNRANPLDWADVLYSRADTSGGFTARTLAAPPLGYPMTGVSFMLTSTCFKSDANRVAMAQFLYTHLRKIRYDDQILSGPANVSTNLLSGTGGTGTARGLTAQSNFAPVSAGWQRAIFDTFLVDTLPTSATGLGARGLWIQSRQPTTAAVTATVTGNTGGTDSNVGGVAGVGCTPGAGA